jgi:predicted deacylase
VTKTLLGKDASGTFDVYRYDFTPETLGVVQTSPWPDYVTPYDSDDYPTIVMDFGIHGSERPCVLAGLNFFEQLAADFGKDTPYGWIRRNVKFSIIPVSNPWGYENNRRVNANHVDLNRNFPIDWNRGGTSDSTSDQYRGSAALSEVEAQYISALLTEYQNRAVVYFNWHTFGNWSNWKITCFSFADCEPDKMLKAAIQTTERMSVNAWQNHAVDSDGEYITTVQMEVRGDGGLSDKYGASLGIPSSCSECLYKLYDGSAGTVYDTTANSMNVEFVALCVQSAFQTLMP